MRMQEHQLIFLAAPAKAAGERSPHLAFTAVLQTCLSIYHLFPESLRLSP